MDSGETDDVNAAYEKASVDYFSTLGFKVRKVFKDDGISFRKYHSKKEIPRPTRAKKVVIEEYDPEEIEKYFTKLKDTVDRGPFSTPKSVYKHIELDPNSGLGRAVRKYFVGNTGVTPECRLERRRRFGDIRRRVGDDGQPKPLVQDNDLCVEDFSPEPANDATDEGPPMSEHDRRNFENSLLRDIDVVYAAPGRKRKTAAGSI